MSCLQCELLRINGRLCHETGCPIGSKPYIYLNCEGPEGTESVLYYVERWSDHDKVGINIVADFGRNHETIYSWRDQDAFDLVEFICGGKDEDILEYWESLECLED